MRSAPKTASPIFIVVLLSVAALAQPPATKATGTIAGRVTVGAQPAPGVEVLLKAGGNDSINELLQSAPATTATTDAEGWYRLTNVAPGSYRVVAYAPAYIVEGNTNPFTPGKTINVAEGEAIETLNFAITRGGVVTGTVTDPDGRTVIAESVKAYKLDETGKRKTSGFPDFSTWQTDDRGMYRIYGLEPGRYLIAAGTSSEDAMIRMGGASGGAYYRRTFYPDAIEEAQAKIVEISSGGEVENIDIKLARASKNRTFVATGRVVETYSGKPVPGVMIGYSVMKTGSASFGFGNSATNSQGEFRLEGLTPNSYQAFVVGLEQSDNYGEPVNFEIREDDVAGLEIKMHQGASVSGVAVIEGVTDAQTLLKLREKLTKVQISAQPVENTGQIFISNISGGTGQITPNGTFKLGSLKPGKVQLIVNTFLAEKGFSLLRIEHNGAEVKELQLTAGVPTTGVRLVFAYGTASIAGRVEVKGNLPPSARLSVRAVRVDATEPIFNTNQGVVDERRQFLIEGLSQGTYKLILAGYPNPADGVKLPTVEQTVTVAANGRQEISLVFDLSKKEGQ